MPSLFKPQYLDKKTGKRKRVAKWYAQYRDAAGHLRRVPLSTDKAAARAMLMELLTGVERERAGLVDPFAAHRARPIAEHLDAYARTFDDRGLTRIHGSQFLARCRAVFAACGFARLADLDAEAVQGWLAERRRLPKGQGGFGPMTHNHYVTAAKAFGNWCVRTKRLPSNPFQYVSKVNTEVDVRHRRRPLTDDEFAALVAAARAGKTFRGIGGPDRAVLYLVASHTGLRVSELASLTPAAFDLDGTPPTVTVEAGYSKRRRRDTLPLHPELVPVLRPWLAGRNAADPLWPGMWADHFQASTIIRRDLREARSSWLDAATSPEDRRRREQSDFLQYRDRTGGVADFHSLRHRFITTLVESGASPKNAKELARHSTIKLTLDRYAHVTLSDMAAALARVAGPTCTKLILPDGRSGPPQSAQDREASAATASDAGAKSPGNEGNPEKGGAFRRREPSADGQVDAGLVYLSSVQASTPF